MADNLERVRLQSTNAVNAALLSATLVNGDTRGTVTVHDEPVSSGGDKIHAGQDIVTCCCRLTIIRDIVGRDRKLYRGSQASTTTFQLKFEAR